MISILLEVLNDKIFLHRKQAEHEPWLWPFLCFQSTKEGLDSAKQASILAPVPIQPLTSDVTDKWNVNWECEQTPVH